jgi:hypothetical protein
MRTAQCACGRVQMTVEDDPVAISACHCDFCQRRSGSVYPASAYFLVDQHFEITGHTSVYNGLETEGVGNALGESITYRFCPTCSSTVYFTLDGRGMRAIPVGNFADPDFPPPTLEVNTATRHRWLPPSPAPDVFEGMPPDA